MRTPISSASLLLSSALLLAACAPALTPTPLAPPFVVRVSTFTPAPALTPAAASQPDPAATASATPRPTAIPQSGDPGFRLRIPTLGVDAGVISLGWHTEIQNGQAVAVWDDPGYAVGYVVSSAPPGQPGNTVMFGHNNIYGAVFKRLVDLQPGAPIEVQRAGLLERYAVSQVLVLQEAGASPEQRAANLRYMDPTSDNRLTLISCWPESSNTHRVVVIAFPAS